MNQSKGTNIINLVSIILPTYNEAENIVDLIKEINQVVKYRKQIIVVDDHSPDGTSNLVSDFINKSKKPKGTEIFLKTRLKSPGLTNSIKDGIKMSKADVIVWMDADFSMPPLVINQLLSKIEDGFDIAVGSRFVKGGKFKHPETGKKDSPVAIILSRMMNYSIQFLLGRHFQDYTSGFVAVRKKVFAKVSFRGDYGEYFIEFIYKSFAYKFKIVEIPYVCLPRAKGESKTGQSLWQYLKRGRKYIQLTLQLLIEKNLLHKIP